MLLDANYFRKLRYTEINIRDIELEIITAQQDEEDASGFGIKDESPLTEEALKQLCTYLRIPYPFTKKLRDQGKAHVLAYIQRQLSQASNENIILVSTGTCIVSVTDEEKLHYRGQEAITLDAKLKEILSTVDSPFSLTSVQCERGDVSYFIMYKESSEKFGDSEYKWGFILSHSVWGSFAPVVTTFVRRLSEMSDIRLPLKTHSYPLPFEAEFDERWNHVLTFIQSPPLPQWISFERQLGILENSTASFREVKEARAKLNKLKVDKEDTETVDRISASLQWKRIKKAYSFLKDMDFKPNKTWYARASSPLRLFDVCMCVAREAAAAPNTIPPELRTALQFYAGKLLMDTPDLSGVQFPPVIDWDSN